MWERRGIGNDLFCIHEFQRTNDGAFRRVEEHLKSEILYRLVYEGSRRSFMDKVKKRVLANRSSIVDL